MINSNWSNGNLYWFKICRRALLIVLRWYLLKGQPIGSHCPWPWRTGNVVYSYRRTIVQTIEKERHNKKSHKLRARDRVRGIVGEIIAKSRNGLHVATPNEVFKHDCICSHNRMRRIIVYDDLTIHKHLCTANLARCWNLSVTEADDKRKWLARPQILLLLPH